MGTDLGSVSRATTRWAVSALLLLFLFVAASSAQQEEYVLIADTTTTQEENPFAGRADAPTTRVIVHDPTASPPADDGVALPPIPDDAAEEEEEEEEKQEEEEEAVEAPVVRMDDGSSTTTTTASACTCPPGKLPTAAAAAPRGCAKMIAVAKYLPPTSALSPCDDSAVGRREAMREWFGKTQSKCPHDPSRSSSVTLPNIGFGGVLMASAYELLRASNKQGPTVYSPPHASYKAAFTRLLLLSVSSLTTRLALVRSAPAYHQLSLTSSEYVCV